MLVFHALVLGQINAMGISQTTYMMEIYAPLPVRALGTDKCSACTTGYVLYDESTCMLPAQSVWPLSVTDCARSCDSPCPRDQFVYANLSCSANCIFPLQQGLVLTATKLCIYPCNPGEYLYWIGICEADCVFPLAKRFQPGETSCGYLCAVADYLYWNGTCSSPCDPPLVAVYRRSRNFCTYPCAANEYLYWDGDCTDSCPSPLVIRAEPGNDVYCDYLCSVAGFLYWNGTCSRPCSLPLVLTTDRDRQFCIYPCSSNEFLYRDGDCTKTCPFPLAPRTELGTDVYYDYLCSITGFLYWKGTCSSTCSPPLVLTTDHERQFCIYPCSQYEYLYPNSTCTLQCKVPYASRREAGKITVRECVLVKGMSFGRVVALKNMTFLFRLWQISQEFIVFLLATIYPTIITLRIMFAKTLVKAKSKEVIFIKYATSNKGPYLNSSIASDMSIFGFPASSRTLQL